MFVVARERVNDAVLDRVQVLKLVDEHDIPARSHGARIAVALEQFGGLDDQRIEVDKLSLREKTLILLEQDRVLVKQRIAAKAMGGEACERVSVPAARSFDAPQGVELESVRKTSQSRI